MSLSAQARRELDKIIPKTVRGESRERAAAEKGNPGGDFSPSVMPRLGGRRQISACPAPRLDSFSLELLRFDEFRNARPVTYE